MDPSTIQQAHDIALAHHQAGRLAEAENAYRLILARQPSHADSLHMLGILSHQTGRAGEAVDLIRRAIAIDPTRAGYHNNLGNVLQAIGDPAAAATAYRQALSFEPQLADAWNNLGNALQELSSLDEAIDSHRKAIALRPQFPQAWYGLASACAAADRPDDAIHAYDQALRLWSDYATARVNRASLLRHLGRLDEAIDDLRRVAETHPAPTTLSNLIYSLYFHQAYDTRQIAEYLARYNRLFAAPLVPRQRSHPNPPSAQRRLRVGYVSPDFNSHPAGRFVLPLLANHDHSQIEVFCYSDVSAPDAITQRLRGHADTWRETGRLGDEQLAGQISNDRIDILVDLTLHLAGNRLLAFARKPAPVQVSWLGYPGSSGLTAMDYRVSDPHLDPPGLNDGLYSEKTVRLPDCYWCYDPLSGPIDAGELPALRNGFITFGCLNNFAKVTGPTIAQWAEVMRQVADSRLLILAPPGSARDRFRGAMEFAGVDPGRIDFADRQPRQRYMELYRRIDLSLDTFPCNGHTTSFDSLWMGVPIVSLSGQTAMSRGGLSILSNLGMRDWATENPRLFVEIAVRESRAVDQIASIRASLRTRLEQSPLMDGRCFARNLEALYRQMWTAWCEGDSAVHPTTPPAGG